MTPAIHNLDWLAQQYMLGELSVSDAERFEQRLADDEAACAALAQATQLVLSLEALTPAAVVALVPTPSRPDRIGRQLVALTAVAACCLVMVLAWSSAPRSSDNLQVRAEIVQAKELVCRWRVTRSLVGALATADEDDDQADADDQAPSWMLAAVSIEKQKPADATTEDEVWEDN
jgi:anti-sigma-K factor RskA